MFWGINWITGLIHYVAQITDTSSSPSEQSIIDSQPPQQCVLG